MGYENIEEAVRKQRIYNALKRKRIKAMRRIPTDKERIRKAKKKGGFDDTFITKERIKHIEKTHSNCYWCKLPSLKADVSEVTSKGNINMICTTPGCPNNPDTTKVDLAPVMKNKYARFVDGKLCFDLGKLLVGRDISKLWANHKGMIG